MGKDIRACYDLSSAAHLAGLLRATAMAFTASLSILYSLFSNWEQFN